MSIESWQNIFEKTIKKKIDLDESVIKKTNNYLSYLKGKWPKNLPEGIIHSRWRSLCSAKIRHELTKTNL